MLFGSLLEAHSENGDTQLTELERELKSKIEKAKNMITALQATSAGGDQTQYATTSSGDLVFPEFNAEINYNQEFWKTFLKNQINFALIKQLTERTAELQQLVKEIEGIQEDYFRLYKLKNRKKNRRLAVEIQKKFQCPYDKCYKFYGSDVSLNLHIKLKHNGGNKTDRQKLAVRQFIMPVIALPCRNQQRANAVNEIEPPSRVPGSSYYVIAGVQKKSFSQKWTRC